MMNYEEWANRMFPKLAFDDIVERTEKLGAKKEVKVCAECCLWCGLHIRWGMTHLAIM